MIVNKRIEMIASYSEQGEVLPIRFRASIDDDLKVFDVKVKVHDKITIEKEKVLVYNCEIKDGDYVKNCEIRFYTASLYWVLYKIS